MKELFSIAVGIQLVLVTASIVAPGLSSFSSIILGGLTIVLLLGYVRGLPENETPVEGDNEEIVNELKRKLVHYEKVSVTDALTGLLNRRGVEDAVTSHIARSKRTNSPFSFILCDIDNFKSINDRYGHAVGDVVISGVAKILSDNLRSSDFAGRWGGEEYLVCLPDTDLVGAMQVAEKLRKCVERLDFDISKVTISLGCSELGDDDFTVSLARADMHLYMAKSKGRNQVFPNSLQKMLDRA